MVSERRDFDVLVIGGGHAGTEAALISARFGCKTALITFARDSVGQMSCNPAIGGLGKGQLVKEIDALFGEMGRAIDDTGIQFRTLNSSKGPAVRSSRAQADREQYRLRILAAVEATPNLSLVEAEASALIVENERILGVRLSDGSEIRSRATVLTTGTFLRGLMHTGEEKKKGGRTGEQASYTLSDSIRALDLRMGRLKTGTPPRLSLRSIDLTHLTEQPGDTPIRPFSFRTESIDRPQISCWLTATNSETHSIIAENVHRSPMFNGQIGSIGPRYCPSIEDKVHRFRDKASHQIFLEPEGFNSDIVYPNGISTSLPRDVQERFVRSIPGLERVEFIRHGYAVEYDYIDPTELTHALSSKRYEGLYFAGQINGTSGYEEAGAQGIIAGINAALFVTGREPFILGRDQGYIGVMIDDLVTLGVLEPYRMFTSRAEFRLLLREDNADARLTPLARKLGVVSDEDWRIFSERQERLERERARLETTFLRPTSDTSLKLEKLKTALVEDRISLSVLLRRPEIRYADLAQLISSEESLALSGAEAERLETEIKFEGYLKRQTQDVERLRRMEEVSIPMDFPYDSIPSLSIEVKQRLLEVRPRTLGQAGRIFGVTPAALSLIAVHLRRGTVAFDATAA